jgi:hypothetical protein
MTLQILYKSGFLQSSPHHEDFTHIFWQAFHDALKNTKKGPDGQKRILSIIATQFTYQELNTKLGVSI